MAELCYFTGPMDCGKSTLALQLAYEVSVPPASPAADDTSCGAGHPL